MQVDVHELRQKSTIYKGLQPGNFLYEYRSRLNEAAFNVALENPTLVANKGALLEQAKQKVDKDGYNYRKKRSRSSTIAPLPENTVKMRPNIRSRQMKQISEDLEEVKKEVFHLEKSREKARNINADERALRITKEMDPLRQKRQRLEEELQLLQQKEKKSLKDKERRKGMKKVSSTTHGLKQQSSSCSKGRLDTLLKCIRSGRGQSSQSTANTVQLSQEVDSADLLIYDEPMQMEPFQDEPMQLEPFQDEPQQPEPSHDKSKQPEPYQDEAKQPEPSTSLAEHEQLPSIASDSESFLGESLGSH